MTEFLTTQLRENLSSIAIIRTVILIQRDSFEVSVYWGKSTRENYEALLTLKNRELERSELLLADEQRMASRRGSNKVRLELEAKRSGFAGTQCGTNITEYKSD